MHEGASYGRETMSPLSMSRSALDRLGKRLAAEGEIADADYDLLLEVLTAYQQALQEAQERLHRLGYSPTSRTKTTGVLVDKLRREHSSLKSVQDIAGTRIICADRDEQNDIVQSVVTCFADGGREPKVKDRRDEPSHGYRAVHVVVTVQDLPVEIQIRTERQDTWAQIVESLGDRWGRQIRYGEGPAEPDRPIMPGMSVTRAELWTLVQGMSDRTDAVERWQQSVMKIVRFHEVAAAMSTADDPDMHAEAAVINEETETLKADLAVAEVDLTKDLALFASIAEKLE